MDTADKAYISVSVPKLDFHTQRCPLAKDRLFVLNLGNKITRCSKLSCSCSVLGVKGECK